MNVPDVDWPTTFEEARDIQEDLAHHTSIKGEPKAVKLVAGCDMSHFRDSPTYYASIVVMRAHNFEIVETAHAEMKVSFPYVPGYLSFREGPVLMKAIKRLRSDIDLWFFDGQGLAHPRRFGLACHMGLLLDAPSIGVAKKKYIGQHKQVGMRAGNRTPLLVDGEAVGDVLRTRHRVSPVYVSPGHKISIKAATDWAFRMTGKTRIPEPTRQAHFYVNRFREESEGSA